MKKQFIEIEIQVRIENSRDLLKFLKKSAKFIAEEHQVDRYFTPADRNFISVKPVKEWLRLREASGKYSINYKNWHYDKDGRSQYSDEYETKIEEIEPFEKIFSALKMKQLATVDKTRKIWIYKSYEVAIDSVKKLGDFVEVEYKGKSSSKKPEEITKEMINFLKQHNCGIITRNYVGYPFQILFPDNVKTEEF